jgi:hypothetical protein
MAVGEAERMLQEQLGSATARVEFENESECGEQGVATEAASADRYTSNIPNLAAQKSLWNVALLEENNDDKPKVLLAPQKDSTVSKLFCMFFPPNMISNRLQGLRDLHLLPESKVRLV